MVDEAKVLAGCDNPMSAGFSEMIFFDFYS
jgi:hypothetical protein